MSEIGTLLLSMALDAPLPATIPDAMHAPVGPLDAFYGAVVALANSDEGTDGSAAQSQFRQRLAVSAIEELL